MRRHRPCGCLHPATARARKHRRAGDLSDRARCLSRNSCFKRSDPRTSGRRCKATAQGCEARQYHSMWSPIHQGRSANLDFKLNGRQIRCDSSETSWASPGLPPSRTGFADTVVSAWSCLSPVQLMDQLADSTDPVFGRHLSRRLSPPTPHRLVAPEEVGCTRPIAALLDGTRRA